MKLDRPLAGLLWTQVVVWPGKQFPEQSWLNNASAKTGRIDSFHSQPLSYRRSTTAVDRDQMCSAWNLFHYLATSLQLPSVQEHPGLPVADPTATGWEPGMRSCWTGPPLSDCRGRGAPSHHLGWIHPYARPCSARYRKGTPERRITVTVVNGGPESVRDVFCAAARLGIL